jgi:hypothetical protein
VKPGIEKSVMKVKIIATPLGKYAKIVQAIKNSA